MKSRRQKAEGRIKKSEIRGRISDRVTSFCLLPSAFCLSSRRGQARLQRLERSDCGQAMIEFTIAIVAIMAVAAGLLLLNRLEWARLSAMTTARGNAGELALAPVYFGALDSEFILDWQTGPDEKHYTPDDQPTPDLNAGLLVDGIVSRAGAIGFGALTTNAISQLGSAPNPINQFYLVKGSENTSVTLADIPVVSSLITKEPTMTVEGEAWLTWTGGIY